MFSLFHTKLHSSVSICPRNSISVAPLKGTILRVLYFEVKQKTSWALISKLLILPNVCIQKNKVLYRLSNGSLFSAGC